MSEQQARCAREESVTKYFIELERILRKYDLFDKPQQFYNIDKKGIHLQVWSVVKTVKHKLSERGKTVTIIGAGNAA